MLKNSIKSRHVILDQDSRSDSILRHVHTADYLINQKAIKLIQKQLDELEVQIGKTIKTTR